MNKNGSGKPVKPGEIRRYEQLREAGWSPQASAEAIGRSKSWAYNHERAKDDSTLRDRQEPNPADNLSDAVALVLAERQGPREAAFEIVDRFGAGVVPDLCRLVWFFATERAENLKLGFDRIFEGEDFYDEWLGEDITAADVLNVIPLAMDKHFAGKQDGIALHPPVLQRYIDRLVAANPDFKAIADEVEEAKVRGDLRETLPELRKRVRAGEFV